ncbi:MAG: hypothetical protein ACOC1K_08025 [Nanoarchaeota archaeon]
MAGKKAQQSGKEAAAFIVVITVMIVLYIMFLPAQDRNELLNQGNTHDSNNNNDDDNDLIYNLTLVDEIPGRLDYLGTKEYEHEIPSVNLLSKTDAKIIQKISPFIIKNNWFEKKQSSFDFNIDNPQNSDNVKLSFNAPTSKGILTITLNDQIIFEKEAETKNLPPVNLPKSALQQSNTLTFSVSGVGIAFWTTNKWSFENTLITADITDKTGFDSESIFTISPTEYFNLEKSELFFATDCSSSEIGKLTIQINGDLVYSAIPDCGPGNPPIDITNSIKRGKNTLELTNDKGQILIEQIRIKNDLKEMPYPVYYFELSDKQYNDIIEEDAQINMTARFTDDYEFKEARIYINGLRTYMTTRENEYVADISPYIEEGSNSIKIEPYGDTLEIREFTVNLY